MPAHGVMQAVDVMPLRVKTVKSNPAKSGHFHVKVLSIRTRKEAEAALRSVGPCVESIPIMAPKLLFFTVKLHSVRAPMANILKQEALGMGAEAAVSMWSVDCSKPHTDIILAGTFKHFSRLIAKMRQQGAGRKTSEGKSEYFSLAEEIEAAVKND